MFEHEKRKFLVNFKIESFYIFIYDGRHGVMEI